MEALLITGGLGFIGGNLVPWLLNNTSRFPIKILDDLSYGHLESIPKWCWKHHRLQFFQGSALDSDIVGKLVGSSSAVIHLVSDSHFYPSRNGFRNNLDREVRTLPVVLEQCAKHGIDKFIFLSSSEVYGKRSEWTMLGDKAETLPTDLYGVNKRACEILVERSNFMDWGVKRARKIPWTIFRLATCFGPRQRPEKFLPYLIISTLENGKDNWSYKVGIDSVLDLVFVDDLCKAIWFALESDKTDLKIFNIGTGHFAEIPELQREVALILGLDWDTWGDDVRLTGELDTGIVLDSDDLLDLCGWRFMFQEEDLEKTVKWYQNNQSWWEPLVKTTQFRKWEKSWLDALEIGRQK